MNNLEMLVWASTLCIQNLLFVYFLSELPNWCDLEARLHIHAAAEWENQRLRKQAKVNSNYTKIQESLNFLIENQVMCELQGWGYYDTFKLQKDVEDFNASAKRLELAGLWDERIEMLRRYRHSKNEDTGPYMVKGRPKHYWYTQRLANWGLRFPSSSVELCFWASIKELEPEITSPSWKWNEGVKTRREGASMSRWRQIR